MCGIMYWNHPVPSSKVLSTRDGTPERPIPRFHPLGRVNLANGQGEEVPALAFKGDPLILVFDPASVGRHGGCRVP